MKISYNDPSIYTIVNNFLRNADTVKNNIYYHRDHKSNHVTFVFQNTNFSYKIYIYNFYGAYDHIYISKQDWLNLLEIKNETIRRL